MAYTTIDDPSQYFQILTYTGNQTDNRALTNTGNSDLQPDLLWIKRRGGAEDADMQDSVRGIGKRLRPARDDGEITDDTAIDSFDSDGFTVDNADQVNGNDTYIAWQWKMNAGSNTNVSASSGVLAVTHQVNTTAGQGIITYTGNGTGSQQITHGLGGRADCIWIKRRDNTNNWAVFSRQQANQSSSSSAALNNNNPFSTSPNPFDGNLGGNSTFYVADDNEVNANNGTYVAYTFRNIKGYCREGRYIGNGNVLGTYVHTGFRPALIIIKKKDETQNWPMFDTELRPRNVGGAVDGDDFMYADLANAEDQSPQFEIYSNGFRPTMTSDLTNGDGHPYFYIAWAKHPFVTSKGTPITAGR